MTFIDIINHIERLAMITRAVYLTGPGPNSARPRQPPSVLPTSRH
jgi:hypothetical protein